MLFISKLDLKKYWAIYVGVLLASIFLASQFPIQNDETYYIAFSRHLQLSYVDHPPFVSYLNLIQSKLGLTSLLSQRLFVLIFHLISTLFLMAIVYNNCKSENTLSTKLLMTFLLAYLIPIFGAYGFFILPDTGLILSLSIMLWAADRVMRAQELSLKNSLFLGLGLGLGLLSKYHIFPLGGGILLGLLIDLSWHRSFRFSNLAKLTLSGIIGLICALPVFIWNFQNHFASFVFQLQHGFDTHQWRPLDALVFIVLSGLILTPWFSYVLIKRGLLGKKSCFLIIPVGSLLIILLLSSMRRYAQPSWICPAFWLLIPYAVIYSTQNSGQLASLIKMCKFTGIIWVMLIGFLLLPTQLNPLKVFAPQNFILFWQDFPNLIRTHPKLSATIESAMQKKQAQNCSEKRIIVGTMRWFWASQLEYHRFFKDAKILNLDLNSSNFYLWRDHWAAYANCPILVIGQGGNAELRVLANIMTIHQHSQEANLWLVTGTLKDSTTLHNVQNTLKNNPHY